MSPVMRPTPPLSVRYWAHKTKEVSRVKVLKTVSLILNVLSIGLSLFTIGYILVNRTRSVEE